MSTPGWYPDPGGRSGHYRFWDGQTWSPLTSSTPGGAVPGPPPAGGPGGPRRRGRWPAVVLTVLAAVLVVAVVVALVVRGTDSPVADPGASPSTSGGVDTSPAATPSDATTPDPVDPTASSSPSVPSGTESPVPQPSDTGSQEPCPVGDPFARQDHPRDGRVHGGSLSFPRQPGWETPGPQASAFTWAYDLGETDVQLAQSRYASYAVGAVSVADGFEDPRTAARLAMRCTVASALYSDVSGRTDLVDEETTVDGYRAWTLRTQIRTYDPRTSYAGDTVQITVVDLDSPEALAFFWGSAPIGDATFENRLDEVVQQLSVG